MGWHKRTPTNSSTQCEEKMSHRPIRTHAIRIIFFPFSPKLDEWRMSLVECWASCTHSHSHVHTNVFMFVIGTCKWHVLFGSYLANVNDRLPELCAHIHTTIQVTENVVDLLFCSTQNRTRRSTNENLMLHIQSCIRACVRCASIVWNKIFSSDSLVPGSSMYYKSAKIF